MDELNLQLQVARLTVEVTIIRRKLERLAVMLDTAAKLMEGEDHPEFDPTSARQPRQSQRLDRRRRPE